MALLSFVGFDTPSLPAQGEQRLPHIFNSDWDIPWQGVGDAAGEPAPITPESVDALLDLWPMAEAFERLYLAPALLLDDEKNG